MAKKRPTIKGRGADIFLEERSRELNRNVLGSQQSKVKATFYIPSSLLDELEEVWLSERRKNRKITKSDIISTGLKKILKEYKEE